jgi:transcriptional regulator of met regulon
MAHAIGTNNEYGKAFSADLEEHCFPAWSLRALGTVEQTRRGCEVKNLRVITWDQVIYPSHSNAYTTRILSENADVITEGAISIGYEKDPNETPNSLTESRIIPLTNDDVRKMISADSKNIKFVKECMDFAYDSVVLSENGARVILTTNEGAKMVVNLERYVKNEIMDYCSKF